MGMKKMICGILCLSGFLNGVRSQTGTTITKDPRIDLVMKKVAEINEFNTREARRFAPGYRILVLSTNDRNKANQMKAKVYRYFPELGAYLVFQASQFKLKVGDFKDLKEAEDYQIRMQAYFSNNLYIVRDQIEVNPDKSAELEK